VVATTPFNVLSAFVFSGTVYGMAGLRASGAAIGQNAALCSLVSLISNQVGVSGNTNYYVCVPLLPQPQSPARLATCQHATAVSV
jgi:hypothetical protein